MSDLTGGTPNKFGPVYYRVTWRNRRTMTVGQSERFESKEEAFRWAEAMSGTIPTCMVDLVEAHDLRLIF